jgi:hypothetical protein
MQYQLKTYSILTKISNASSKTFFLLVVLYFTTVSTTFEKDGNKPIRYPRENRNLLVFSSGTVPSLLIKKPTAYGARTSLSYKIRAKIIKYV